MKPHARISFSLLPSLNLMIVPSRGKHINFQANTRQRALLAQEFDLLAISSLSAWFDIKPQSRGRFHLQGGFMAELTQSCVVTLETVAQKPKHEFERHLIVGSAPALPPAQIDIEYDMADPPEFLENGCLEFDSLLREELALSLTLYPRNPDAKFYGFQTSQETGDVIPPDLQASSGPVRGAFAGLSAWPGNTRSDK